MNWLKYSAIAASLLVIFMLGRLSVKQEVRIIEKEVKVNYWDMTTMTEEKVEVAANYFGKTFQDIKVINEIHKENREEIKKLAYVNREKLKSELEEIYARHERGMGEFKKIYDKRKDEAEKITHRSYQRGYQEGYRDGRGR